MFTEFEALLEQNGFEILEEYTEDNDLMLLLGLDSMKPRETVVAMIRGLIEAYNKQHDKKITRFRTGKYTKDAFGAELSTKFDFTDAVKAADAEPKKPADADAPVNEEPVEYIDKEKISADKDGKLYIDTENDDKVLLGEGPLYINKETKKVYTDFDAVEWYAKEHAEKVMFDDLADDIKKYLTDAGYNEEAIYKDDIGESDFDKYFTYNILALNPEKFEARIGKYFDVFTEANQNEFAENFNIKDDYHRAKTVSVRSANGEDIFVETDSGNLVEFYEGALWVDNKDGKVYTLQEAVDTLIDDYAKKVALNEIDAKDLFALEKAGIWKRGEQLYAFSDPRILDMFSDKTPAIAKYFTERIALANPKWYLTDHEYFHKMSESEAFANELSRKEYFNPEV